MKTGTEYQAEYRRRQRDGGLVHFQAWLPSAVAADLHEMVEALRDNPTLTLRLFDTDSGRMVLPRVARARNLKRRSA
jgi:hypothetical protein